MLKPLLCALFLTFTTLATLAGDAPRPAEVSPADARAVRSVVEAQLKALATDDAPQAFWHAAPAIQKQFSDAASFAQMVRRAYPMLIRPVSISFYRPLASASAITQSVMFRDAEGRVWRADYALQQQADQRWRIEGCQVVRSDEASTT